MPVVVISPRGDLLLGVFEIQEDLGIQALVAKAALEGLHEAIFRRFAWGGKVELDASLEGPRVERFGGEFRSVIGRDDLGQPAPRSPLQQRRDPLAGEAGPRLKYLA